MEKSALTTASRRRGEGRRMTAADPRERSVPSSARRARRAVAVEEQLSAIIAVSRAVAEGTALEDTLATIARAAAELVDASASAIILRQHVSATGLVVAGSYGLSPEYASELNRIHPIELGEGPSGVAAAEGRPVAVADVLNDPIFGPWRSLAVREHYGSMVSIPLKLGTESVIGVLNAYRREPSDWTADDTGVLLSLADHAAIAIRTAQLLEESRHQVKGLSLIVQSLRAQSHEHSNLLHAISGLLAMDEVEEARRLIATSEARYHSAYARVTARIESAALAGFLLAEAVTAGNSGIELRIDRRSRVRALPSTVSELEAITILGNLIRNALEAVSDKPNSLRRVNVLVSDARGVFTVRVRDWGDGIPAEAVGSVFDSGYSTKREHAGVGLHFVRNIVHKARGTVAVEPQTGAGVAVVVRIPFQA